MTLRFVFPNSKIIGAYKLLFVCCLFKPFLYRELPFTLPHASHYSQSYS